MPQSSVLSRSPGVHSSVVTAFFFLGPLCPLASFTITKIWMKRVVFLIHLLPPLPHQNHVRLIQGFPIVFFHDIPTLFPYQKHHWKNAPSCGCITAEEICSLISVKCSGLFFTLRSFTFLWFWQRLENILYNFWFGFVIIYLFAKQQNFLHIVWEGI